MIIGISAKIGCGKTTLTNLFIQYHPQFIRKAFADLLKQEAAATYGYPNIWNYTEDGKNQVVNHFNLPKKDMTVREILQWHGTDFRRKQDPDYWVKLMDRQVDSDYFNIIVDDVRFRNEADFVKRRNGKLIRLNPYPGWKPNEFANHRSETDLDDYKDWDLIIQADYGKLAECVPLVEALVDDMAFDFTVS